MAIDINDEFKKASEKSKVFKKYKEYKEDYEDLKKKAGDSQEEANKKISQSLDKFTQWRKKHTTEGKTLIDQLIKQLKEIKGSGIETNTLIKRIFVNSLKKIKPDIKKIIIEEAKKALACSNLQKFQFNKTYYIPVRSIDLFGAFELSPTDKIGKFFYETEASSFNNFPYSMNRQLYDRIQNLNQPYSAVAGSNYNGTSQQQLFDITYVENYIDPITNQPQQGNFFKVDIKPRQTAPIVDEFLNDYYSTIDVLDYKTFFTNLVDYVTGAISFGRGDGKLKLSSIQKVLTIMKRILGLCEDKNKEIEVSSSSKLSEVDTIDDSFYEFNEIDLRTIDQITSNIKKGVIEFEDCDNVKVPLNVDAVLNALDNLNFVEGNLDPNELNAALGIIYPVVDEDPAYKLSLDEGFFEKFVKAVMNTILSPKNILPIMIVAGMVNQPIFKDIKNIEDFSKKFKNFFNEVLTKIGAVFTKAIFEELKKEIKTLIMLIIKDLNKEKRKKLNRIILAIIALIPALIKITKDFRECRSVIDELLQLLDVGIKSAIGRNPVGNDIPLPLLLASKFSSGFSPTRSFLNVIQNLEEIGIPTGPMPDGSPNEFLVAIKAIIEGNAKDYDENSKVSIGIGPLTVTPAGVTIPQVAYGKLI